jgi:hypothetical protein
MAHLLLHCSIFLRLLTDCGYSDPPVTALRFDAEAPWAGAGVVVDHATARSPPHRVSLHASPPRRS